MNTLKESELQDIQKIVEDKDYFYSLPEHRKTDVVSLAAVALYPNNLEYVPYWLFEKNIIGREICRAALSAKDAECCILSNIPYPDVQKEGAQQFLANGEPPFLVYSFAEMQNSQMAQDAVKSDAYCIQLVPSKLLTKDLCRTALESPNSDEKVAKFVYETFPELQSERTAKEENTQRKAGAKMKF